MKISEMLKSCKSTAFSFELLPPLKGNSLESLTNTIDKLKEFNPKYINITTHRSEVFYRDMGNGLFKAENIRRRPGAVAVAAAIQQRYGIPVVPHILCSGFTREETEYVLLDLQFLGINNLFLLRGDKAKNEKTYKPVEGGNAHATDLEEQVNRYNEGYFINGDKVNYIGEKFDYGVACYPEKHEEAPNMETDLAWFKRKAELRHRIRGNTNVPRQRKVLPLRGKRKKCRNKHTYNTGNKTAHQVVATHSAAKDIPLRHTQRANRRNTEMQK